MSGANEGPKPDSEEQKTSMASPPQSKVSEAPEVQQEEVKRKLVEILAKGRNTFFCFEDDQAISEHGLFAALQAGPNRIEQLDDVTDLVQREDEELYGLMFIHRYENGHVRLLVASSSGGLFFTSDISLSGLQKMQGRNRKPFTFKDEAEVSQLLKDSYDLAKSDISAEIKAEKFGVGGKEDAKLSHDANGTVLLNRSEALNFQDDIKTITAAAKNLKGSAGRLKNNTDKLSGQLAKQEGGINDLGKKITKMGVQIEKLSGLLGTLQKTADSIEKRLATDDGELGGEETHSNTPRGGAKQKKHKGETGSEVIYRCKSCRLPEQQCRCPPGSLYPQPGGYRGYGGGPPGYPPPYYGGYQ
jgi:hypothetical protein